MHKKMIVFLLLFSFVCGFVYHAENSKAVSDAEKAKTAYARFLEKQKKEEYMTPFFQITDLDGDGVPEFMWKKDVNYNIWFYRFQAGKVKKITVPDDDIYDMFPNIGTGIHFYKKKKMISIHSYNSAGNADHYYQYDGKKMSLLFVRCLLYGKGTDSGKDEYAYYQGNTKISKKKFKSLKKRYIGNAKKKVIVLQEVTKKNIKKILSEDVEEELASENAADDFIGRELGKLAGEYEYSSDYGKGRLIIEKKDYTYDISDYESASSYRFLANSSNIENIENNRIYIKYPEQVFQDDTVIFSYYILEYGENEMDVYYRESEHAEEQFLYHAIKKN